jgi:hypothetical protein
VEYKKSEDFAKASARGKQSRAKKEHDHHLGRGGYAFVVPKWWEIEEDLLTQGTTPAVVDWPERVKNWYFSHGGTINSEDGTLDYPPLLRETALEILKTLEDVRAGRVNVDREISELTMALKNPEHPGRFRGFGVVLLTPKIGTGKGLTCWPSLVTKCHSVGKISSEDSVKMLAVGNTPSFGRRTVCA